jgi:hypothetical protein
VKPKRVQIIFQNPARTSKRTHFTITKINSLSLFKEIIAVYTENISAIISLNSVNLLIFLMVKCGVLFEVRAGFLNIRRAWATIITSSLPFYPYQKDERALPGYLLTRWSFSPQIKSASRFPPDVFSLLLLLY